MNIDRLDRVNELLKHEIGELLFRVINENNFDLSAVTVTRVIASRNLRNARVLISIRGHEHLQQRMLAIIKKHRRKIQQRINADTILKYTPRLTFKLDTSIEEGDRVLQRLLEIEESI